MGDGVTRFERHKVPLGAGGGQHFVGVDAQPAKNHRQLVHQRNVQIPLGVFSYLHDGGYPVFLITWINPLRAVARVKVLIKAQARHPLQHRHAHKDYLQFGIWALLPC